MQWNRSHTRAVAIISITIVAGIIPALVYMWITRDAEQEDAE